VREVRAHVVQQQIAVGGELLVAERRDGARPGAECRHVTGGAPDLREQVAAVALVVATSQGAGRGEEAHEGVGLIERRLVDLRVGDARKARAAPGGNGSWVIPSAA